jgi:hypothetical protein
MWIPKFLMWKIWLERNNRLFREQNCNPNQVAIKAKALMVEALDSQTTIRNVDILEPDEDQWLKEFIPNHQHRIATNPVQKESWEVRLEE